MLRPCGRIPVTVILTYIVLSAVFCSRFFSWLTLNSHGILDGDPALNAWALQWVSHALLTAPWDLVNGNTFHPTARSVTLSEPMYTLAVINVLFRPFSESPWFGYNLLIFLAYLLSCTGAYRLAASLTGSRLIGVWGGIFWGFLFFRVHHIGHLQILSFQWMPYCLHSLLRLFDEPRPRTSMAFGLFFVAQALTSWYLATINTAVLGVCALCFAQRRYLTLSRVKLYGTIAVGAWLALFPFALLSFENISRSSLGTRMSRTLGSGDNVLAVDYFFPPDVTWIGSRIHPNKYWIWQENTLFIGYVALLLSGLGLVAAIVRAVGGKLTTDERRLTFAGVALIGAGYVLALGFVSPAWDLRLPLWFIAEWFRPVAGLRATQRFSLVLYMGVLILSVQGLHWVVQSTNRATLRRAIVVFICAIYLFEVFPAYPPINAQQRFEFSGSDREIDGLQRTANRTLTVLHLPIYYFRQPYPISEASYMAGSTLHWARILNGFSGELPNGFMTRMTRLNHFPSEDAWEALTSLGVDLVAVHPDVSADSQKAMVDFVRARGGTAISVGPREQLLSLCSKGREPALGCR